MILRAQMIEVNLKTVGLVTSAIGSSKPRHNLFVQPSSSRPPSVTRKFSSAIAMDSAVIAEFSKTPWAASLIQDPQWTTRNTASRRIKPSGEDSFFAETLKTDRTIRALLTLKPVKEDDDDQPYKEIVTIMELGDGLNGFPQIAHGGLVATLLDEVCGILITINLEKKRERLKSLGLPGTSSLTNYLTAYLNTTYKKPVPTPGLILCRAKIDRQDGRKLYIRATTEDGHGTVFTVAEGLFIEATTKL